jgi:hypothetical protein
MRGPAIDRKACSTHKWGENKGLQFLDLQSFDDSKEKRHIFPAVKMIPITH